MKSTFIKSELKELRSILRKLLVAGRLEWRRTYYDYYDSCHAPIETPDAPFEAIPANSHAWLLRDLKAGGDSISLISPGVYELWTSYSRRELRVIK